MNTTTSPSRDRGPVRRLGFLGLGHMGSVMAARLVDAGHDVTVWSRTKGKTDALVERGATAVDTPEEVIATGLVFSMLSHEQAVREVFTAERLRAAPEGFIHVNHATVSPRAASEFAAAAAEHGHRYLSAPVVGRPDAVAAGKLHILVSGDPAAVDAVTPVLPALGQRFWEFGPDAASASVVKIGVNYLLVHTLQALSESVVLLERQGLDTDRFISLLNDSVFPGPAYGGYGRMIASSTYTPVGFSTTLGLKDLMLALDVADGLGVDLPTGPALREVFETAADQVGSDLDWSCVAEVTRRRSAGPARPDAS